MSDTWTDGSHNPDSHGHQWERTIDGATVYHDGWNSDHEVCVQCVRCDELACVNCVEIGNVTECPCP